MIDIQKNYLDTIKQIQDFLIENKNFSKPEVIAVSKKQSVESIQKIIDMGHRSFGENQIQELELKWPALKDKYPDIKTHFIGSIQSRKIPSICNLCNVIHSIDREKIIKKIYEIKQNGDPIPELFMQVNVGLEPQKGGVSPNDIEDFIQLSRQKYNIEFAGLMCIPPINKESQYYFKKLVDLAKKNNINKLSMGMSNDYIEAIQEGSTHVRIGTSIFGIRN